MEKFIDLPPFDLNGEPNVRLITPDSYELSKLASSYDYPKELTNFMATLKSDPKFLYLLINAVGAFEYWGFNKNGDGFPETNLLEVQTIGETRDGNSPVQRYKTFEKYAKLYKQHNKNNPDYDNVGNILLSTYDNKMHRILIIAQFIRARDLNIAWKIENGYGAKTSMGCKVPFDVCVKNDTPIITDTGAKKIIDVKLGDLVMTHAGRFMPVTKKFERLFTGDLITLRLKHDIRELTLTANHSVLAIKAGILRSCHGSVNGVKRRHTFTNGKCNICGVEEPVPEWIPAGEIESGDYLVFPKKTHGNNLLSLIDNDLAWLIGLYAGDGWPLGQKGGRKKNGKWRDHGISLSLGKDKENIIKKLRSLSDRFNIKIYPDGDKKAVIVNIRNKDLVKLCRRFVGSGSHTKRLHYDIFEWSLEAKLSFMAGFLDADGSKNENTESCRLSIVNRQLALDFVNLARSLGIPASISSYLGKSGFNDNDVIVYQVFIPASSMDGISQFSQKINLDTTIHPSSTEFCTFLHYLAVPIDNISEESVIDYPVYNIAVEDDETYIANGITVHNCSICGNKSPTRKAYCDHLKYYMGSIDDNGRAVGAFNTKPRFDDLSFVHLAAWVPSRIIMKVAKDRNQPPRKFYSIPFLVKQSIDKESEIEKTIPGQVMGNVEKLKYNEPMIKKDDLNYISQFTLPQILASFYIMGMQPKPQELQRVIIKKAEEYLFEETGRRDWADELDKQGIFLNDNYEEQEKVAFGPTDARFEICRTLYDYIPQRSVFGKHLDSRLSTEKLATYISVPPIQSVANISAAIIPLAAFVAGAMAIFRLKGLNFAKFFPSFIKANTWFIPAIIGGGAVVSGIMATEPPSRRHWPNIEHKKAASFYSKAMALSSLTRKAVRTAGKGVRFGAKHPSLLVAGSALPAAYLGAGYLQAREQSGLPTIAGLQFVERHPFMTGAAASALGLLRYLKTVGK